MQSLEKLLHIVQVVPHRTVCTYENWKQFTCSNGGNGDRQTYKHKWAALYDVSQIVVKMSDVSVSINIDFQNNVNKKSKLQITYTVSMLIFKNIKPQHIQTGDTWAVKI